MDRGGCGWTEEATNGPSRLQKAATGRTRLEMDGAGCELDGEGYKWMEKAANGRSRLRTSHRVGFLILL